MKIRLVKSLSDDIGVIDTRKLWKEKPKITTEDKVRHSYMQIEKGATKRDPYGSGEGAFDNDVDKAFRFAKAQGFVYKTQVNTFGINSKRAEEQRKTMNKYLKEYVAPFKKGQFTPKVSKGWQDLLVD